MADNVTLPGTGAVVAADEVDVGSGAAQVQYVKLVDGTANGTQVIAGDAQGLWIVPRRDVQRISVQSGGLTTATTSYTAGDQMGNQFTLANAARANGGTGYITSVALVSAATNIGAVDVVFFRASVSLASDNSAFSISDADALSVVAVVPLAGAYAWALNRYAFSSNIAVPYDTGSGTSLYAALITRSAHTFFGATTDLQLIVHVERN